MLPNAFVYGAEQPHNRIAAAQLVKKMRHGSRNACKNKPYNLILKQLFTHNLTQNILCFEFINYFGLTFYLDFVILLKHRSVYKLDRDVLSRAR